MTTPPSAHQIWLMYFNEVAFQNGLISEQERNLLKSKILAQQTKHPQSPRNRKPIDNFTPEITENMLDYVRKGPSAVLYETLWICRSRKKGPIEDTTAHSSKEWAEGANRPFSRVFLTWGV